MCLMLKDEFARVLMYVGQQLPFYIKPIYYNFFYLITISVFGQDVKNTTTSHTFWAAAPKLWNNLPLFVKSSRSYYVLKRRLKSYLFAQVFT